MRFIFHRPKFPTAHGSLIDSDHIKRASGRRLSKMKEHFYKDTGERHLCFYLNLYANEKSIRNDMRLAQQGITHNKTRTRLDGLVFILFVNIHHENMSVFKNIREEYKVFSIHYVFI